MPSEVYMENIAVHCAHDELAPIEKLVGNPRNPNIHPKSQIELLAKVIAHAGWRAPITVSTRSGFIVRGHGRYAAAKLLGCGVAPVDYQDYATEAEEWADLIADNRIAELAETDGQLLAGLLRELDSMDFNIEFAGFEDKDLEKLLRELEEDGEDKEPSERPKIINAASLDELAPSDEELGILAGKRFLVEFSGGKDSSAAVAWLNRFFPDAGIELMFVDMGADFVGFQLFHHAFAGFMGHPLRILRTSETLFELMLRKGDWPMFMHPYCHDLLHDAIDRHLLAHDPNEIVVVRGGRLAERAKTGKVRASRFMEVDRLPNYRFFQPLYFGAKDVSEQVLAEAGAPVWEGYGFGLQRTACRVCPGQKPSAYAAIRANFPEVWGELLSLEARFGAGCWQRREDGEGKGFEELADLGREAFEAGEFRRR
jgi:3'-phosphoadenosine 5'-phosphosulfate sulfotransferase (PAPS reductase)/FAD synthetase